MDLNQLIEGASSGSTLRLPSGEFEGPFVISKPLHLIGNNTTLWAKNGAVLKINSNGVVIENLRVELTDGDVSDTAVASNFLAAVKNVEILGGVSGFGSEDGCFDVPRTIELGEFRAEDENSFVLSVNVPEKTEIFCNMREVTISPAVLSAGRNDITVSVSGISAQTLLYAEIMFKSAFTRRVYLTGKPKTDAEAASFRQVYSAPVRKSAKKAKAAAPQTDVISLSPPQAEGSARIDMTRGLRTALAPYIGSSFSVYFSCEKSRNADIDPYVFLLDRDGRALSDNSLIFFGNERSENGEVRYFPDDGHIDIDLAAVDYRVEKIVLAYAVYAADAFNNFSIAKNPKISIRTDSERISFAMDGLSEESAIVAAEIYLYKGEWKISAVGAGYNGGVARLCESYGIEVE